MKLEQEGKCFLHILSFDDVVDVTLGEKEFGGLEILWQGFLYGLFDDSLSGKADESLRLSQGDVGKAGKGSGDASCRRIRQDGDEKLLFTKLSDGLAGLGHLEEGDDTLLHPGSARTGEEDERLMFLQGRLGKKGHPFSADASHASHHEIGIHDTDKTGDAVDLSSDGKDGFVILA